MAITDPMNFELLRDGLEATLIANQGSLFRTIGSQKQSTGAEEVKGILRTVQVFYNTGNYPRGKSGRQKFEHDTGFQLEYTVSSPSKADLTVLNDPGASAPALQAALLASSEGTRLADRLLDELRRIVTQILMDPVNQDLGLTKYLVSDPWLSNFRKNEPLDKGGLIVLTASEMFSAVVTETTAGAATIAAVIPAFDIDSDERPLNNDTGFEAPKSGVQTKT